jgi:hypothetical protein
MVNRGLGSWMIDTFGYDLRNGILSYVFSLNRIRIVKAYTARHSIATET